jgi:hypothetical protein
MNTYVHLDIHQTVRDRILGNICTLAGVFTCYSHDLSCGQFSVRGGGGVFRDRGGLKRPVREADHSPTSSAEVTKIWICTPS